MRTILILKESWELCHLYLYLRLKCCDDRFDSDLQHILLALDRIENNAAAIIVHCTERK